MNSNSDFNKNREAYNPPYADINSYQNYPLDIINNTQNSGNVPPLIRNQTNNLPDYELRNMQISLKSNAKFIACSNCKYQSLSRADKQCSTKNVLCCVFFGPLPWLIFQAARNKDINCYDANHYCIRCNVNLANYKAC